MKSFNQIVTIMLINICLSLNCQALDVIVSDGDTIKIDNRKIRLLGIDAPESKQKCFDDDNKPWDCER